MRTHILNVMLYTLLMIANILLCIHNYQSYCSTRNASDTLHIKLLLHKVAIDPNPTHYVKFDKSTKNIEKIRIWFGFSRIFLYIEFPIRIRGFP